MVTEITAVVNAGHLSCQNGATAPLSFLCDLAKACDISISWGRNYGEDMIQVNKSDWLTVEQLLIENKMLYKVSGKHDTWQNVQSPTVAELLARFS